MAHKVKTKKIAVLRKDGTVIPNKYTYHVRCVGRCGVHWRPEPVSSLLKAEALKQDHHFDVASAHIRKHPHDKVYLRTQLRKR